MATRKIHSSFDSLGNLVNVFDGVKMALLRRGRIPRHIQAKAQKTEKTKEKEAEKPEVEKLSEVAEKAHEILYKTDTVFPFTLFPDTITVEREKISIAKRYFFRVAQII